MVCLAHCSPVTEEGACLETPPPPTTHCPSNPLDPMAHGTAPTFPPNPAHTATPHPANRALGPQEPLAIVPTAHVEMCGAQLGLKRLMWG